MNGLEKINEIHRRGEISRRSFMSSAIAMGLSVSSATLLANQVQAAVPKRGGLFKIGIGYGATTDTLDPGTFGDYYMLSVGLAARNCLFEINNDDELVGELVESWEVSPDAKTWVFNLRKGVEFHNGKTLTPEDVIASIQHHIADGATSVAKATLASITDVSKDGPNTVVVTLSEGNADFPYLMSDYHVEIMPEKDGQADWRSGVGTGGYVIENFDPGVKTTMTRNPNYWKSNSAHFDAIEVLAILDQTARTNALTSGVIDAMDRVDMKTAHLLARNPNVSIKETAGGLHFNYTMMCNVAPFDNVDVRLAMKYAMNREEFLQKILNGYGYLGNDHPIARFNQYFAEDLPQRQYDPEKAKFHLKKAGYSDLKVDLNVAEVAFNGAVDGALLYSEMARKAGIDINVVREPNDGYWSNVWNQKPFSASFWSGRVTEDWMFSLAYTSNAPWNESKWDNDRFNKLLLEARSELDTVKRRAMYYELQKLVSDDCGAITPVFSSWLFATSSKIAHGNLSGAWDLDGGKGLERWWFA